MSRRMTQAEVAVWAAEAVIDGCHRRPTEVAQFLDRWGAADFPSAWCALKGVWKIGAGLDAIRHHHFDRYFTGYSERACTYTWGLALRYLAEFRDQVGEWRLVEPSECARAMNEILREARTRHKTNRKRK